MRTLTALALVLVACGCADSSSRPPTTAAPPTVPSGPDAILLRIPRGGGSVVARAYPRMDSVVWRSAQRTRAVGRFITFGAEDGYLSVLDTSGAPVRIDLRLGTIVSQRGALSAAASIDGGSVYGINSKGVVTRFTPGGGDWKIESPLPASALLPQTDGSLIGAGEAEGNLVLWRVRPPDTAAVDTMIIRVRAAGESFSTTIQKTAATVGNRVYLAAVNKVVALNSRDFSLALNLDAGEPVSALALTPSGDRVFVALDGVPRIRIIDRFQEGFSGNVRLPSPATDLRMDPLGRVVLARGDGDSILVVSVADGKLRGALVGDWRSDLPLVLADGRIAVARDHDVVIADAATLADDELIAGGAKDLWYTIRWNGFRPRSPGLDQPVEFRRSEMRFGEDSGITVGADSGALAPDSIAARDSSANGSRAAGGTASGGAAAGNPPVRSAQAEDSLYTVSFATLLNERQAQETARRIRVDNVSPRVVTSELDGRTVFRVVLGPYRSRADAERIGKASGNNYWIYTGVP